VAAASQSTALDWGARFDPPQGGVTLQTLNLGSSSSTTAAAGPARGSSLYAHTMIRRCIAGRPPRLRSRCLFTDLQHQGTRALGSGKNFEVSFWV